MVLTTGAFLFYDCESYYEVFRNTATENFSQCYLRDSKLLKILFKQSICFLSCVFKYLICPKGFFVKFSQTIQLMIDLRIQLLRKTQPILGRLLQYQLAFDTKANSGNKSLNETTEEI